MEAVMTKKRNPVVEGNNDRAMADDSKVSGELRLDVARLVQPFPKFQHSVAGRS
jgi:hypothetical protein